ncbi:MAG TPA: hypothetical protein P5058_05740, partial [Eubacteriales bacterium]|nr:hypothetical protein [Eubacteriales bacterium]
GDRVCLDTLPCLAFKRPQPATLLHDFRELITPRFFFFRALSACLGGDRVCLDTLPCLAFKRPQSATLLHYFRELITPRFFFFRALFADFALE